MKHDVWDLGSMYEGYVGRWSRPVARAFLRWLEVGPGRRWLDVGSGTGALTETIVAVASPAAVLGVDLSPAFVAHARDHVGSDVARFEQGDAQALSIESASFDAAVSGLAVNFVPAPERAVGEMKRAVRPEGVVAAYVWDYAGRMDMMRHFWDAAVALDPNAAGLDEGVRFPLCGPAPLEALWREARLDDVETRSIDVPTRFADFDDYWQPFLGGQGPAPGYVMSLTEDERALLRDRVKASLPTNADGSIDLVARAWAVRGRR